MKKTLFIILLILGSNWIYAQDSQFINTNGQVQMPKNLSIVMCDIFPLCYSNNLKCDITVCPKITIEVGGISNTYSGPCRTIAAGSSYCFTLAEFQSVNPGVNFPTNYANNLRWYPGSSIGFSAVISFNSHSITFNSGVLSPENEHNIVQLYDEGCLGQSRRTMAVKFKGCPATYMISQEQLIK